MKDYETNPKDSFANLVALNKPEYNLVSLLSISFISYILVSPFCKGRRNVIKIYFLLLTLFDKGKVIYITVLVNPI